MILKYVERRIIVKNPINIENKRNKLQKGDVQKYDLTEGQGQSFLINSFHKIGWQDPFPSEDNKEFDEIDIDLNEKIASDPLQTNIYSSDKITGGESPMMMYIPNKLIMFKLMRSCIDVVEHFDLWVIEQEQEG